MTHWHKHIQTSIVGQAKLIINRPRKISFLKLGSSLQPKIPVNLVRLSTKNHRRTPSPLKSTIRHTHCNNIMCTLAPYIALALSLWRKATLWSGWFWSGKLNKNCERIPCNHNSTIMSCCKVAGIVRHTGVVATNGRLKIRGCVIALVLKHATRYFVWKFFHLFVNISLEVVAGPSTNHRDWESGNSGQIHRHGCARSNEVCAYVSWCETQPILTHTIYRWTKFVANSGGRDAREFIANIYFVDQWAFVGTKVWQDWMHHFCPWFNGT